MERSTEMFVDTTTVPYSPVLYISGPIFGYPDGNREAFNNAKTYLASLGCPDTVNPHDVPPAKHDGKCPNTYRGEGDPHDAACYMRGDLICLLCCDGIYLLDGWEKSRGATLEFAMAKAIGLDIYYETVPESEYQYRTLVFTSEEEK